MIFWPLFQCDISMSFKPRLVPVYLHVSLVFIWRQCVITCYWMKTSHRGSQEHLTQARVQTLRSGMQTVQLSFSDNHWCKVTCLEGPHLHLWLQLSLTQLKHQKLLKCAKTHFVMVLFVFINSFFSISGGKKLIQNPLNNRSFNYLLISIVEFNGNYLFKI